MSVTRTGQITVSVPARRSSGVGSGLWAARAHTLPWCAAVVAHPWVASQLEVGLRPALALTAGAAATSSIVVARSARSRHRERMRAHRLRRGDLGLRYPLDGPLPSEEGVFRLGVQSEPGPRGDHELTWRPWDGDPPNLMAAGTTGSGKTEAVRLMICHALGWGWDVEVIDLKGSTEYHPLEVHDTTASARDCLGRVMADIRRRGELLRSIAMPVEDVDGTVYPGRARNFRDVPVKLRGTFRSRLVVIDEAALFALPSSADPKAVEAGRKAIALLQAATALVRSLGIHIVLAVQRPDADLLPGFTKNNLQARLLLGKNDDEAQRMTLTNAVASEAVELSDVTERPPGRCVAVGVGTPAAVLGHTYLLHDAALLRAVAARPDFAAASAGGSSGRPSPSSAPAVPAPSAASAREGSGPPSGLVPPGVSSFAAPPAASPVGRPVAPLAPASSARSVRASVARAALRASAWRLLIGPVRARPSPRPVGIRSACLARRGRACAACGDLAGPHDVDHLRPRWARGSDRMHNLWVLCTRCHAAKTAEEVMVRRVRSRVGLRGLARVPAWVWPFAAAVPLGALAAPQLVLIVAAVLIAQGAVVLFRRSGLDGLPTADARLEVFYGGPVGVAARVRTALFAGVGALRLVVGVWGLCLLSGLMLTWWWAAG
jgi:5-methylcytosine-specific restriction endonuclease McrA